MNEIKKIYKWTTYKKFLLVQFVVFIPVFSSCDCRRHKEGTILDLKTKQPIKDVIILNANKPNDYVYSDEMGNFEISTISGGFKCPEMKLSITKKGYKPQVISSETYLSDTIYLEKENIWY